MVVDQEGEQMKANQEGQKIQLPPQRESLSPADGALRQDDEEIRRRLRMIQGTTDVAAERGVSATSPGPLVLGMKAAIDILRAEAVHENEEAEHSSRSESFGEARMFRETARSYASAAAFLESKLLKLTDQ